MERFSGYSLFAKNFKCFGETEQGFENIRRLNLVIGRNNTGKSALLDLVRFATRPFDTAAYAHRNGQRPTVRIYNTLTVEMLRFPQELFRRQGQGLVGARLGLELESPGVPSRGEFSLDKGYRQDALDWEPSWRQYLVDTARQMPNPLSNMRFAQIAAERDIVAENGASELVVAPSGAGATNIIQKVINDERLPSELVEKTLLDDLNRIMGPDANFTRISVQRRGDNQWVVYLDERAKGRISLSDSGSGLKTVLLVLINLLVVPILENKETSSFVYAFEELENNLHPGLQRRLLKYVKDKLEKSGAIGFVTTHSPAVIDMFSGSTDAQICHVIHDGESATVTPVSRTVGGHRVLDDLDVKASDLLQANGIIWVEGISDVIYLRRWIALYCQQAGREAPVEGSEFAFMEYGGRCLSHFDFRACSQEDLAVEDAKWLLPALAFSRNTAVVMDSDKRDPQKGVNTTKTEASQAATYSWITTGREIENYLPPKMAEMVFGAALGLYDSAAEIHLRVKETRLDKKMAALAAANELNPENWVTLDLKERIEALVETIALWNPAYGHESNSLAKSAS